MARSRFAKVLKTGCLGCGGLIGVSLLVFGGLAGIAVLTSPDEARERRSLEQPLPLSVTTGSDPAPPGAYDGLRSGFDGSAFPTGKPGRVELDFSEGILEIEPGPAGQPIRVEADYDTNRYELVQEFESDESSGWTYRLHFRRIGALGWFRVRHDEPEVRLILPADTPMTLTGGLGVGVSQTELGGLWIVETDLWSRMGVHEVSIDRPTPVPMRRFAFRGSMGVIQVDELGNASPEEVAINHRMGVIDVDLRGEWVTDGTVRMNVGMGEVSLDLPRNVGVVLDRVGVGLGEASVPSRDRLPEPEPGRPTVTVTARSKLGHLQVNR